MNNFNRYKEEVSANLDMIDLHNLDLLIRVLDTVDQDEKVIVCGNGGSFANAQHFAQDLQKICGITAVALGSNPSYLTAVSNDEKYSDAFRNELASIVFQGDVVVILSCSGNSSNIVKVAKYMNKNDWGYTIAITGSSEKMKVKKYADLTLEVNSDDYGIIEGVHSVLLHYIVKTLKELKDECIP